MTGIGFRRWEINIWKDHPIPFLKNSKAPSHIYFWKKKSTFLPPWITIVDVCCTIKGWFQTFDGI